MSFIRLVQRPLTSLKAYTLLGTETLFLPQQRKIGDLIQTA